ncbi:MAG: hypothetical protein QF441_09720 [Bacteriovoracaceae bacterium]|jgi:hypothetical protein|nr:hypothetical protein [Bacteriovoracaceae bacterium]
MPKSIDEIRINNIKGISSLSLKFNGLFENRLNILVAPNGFGKTSFAVGFDSMSSVQINLQKDDLHNGSTSLVPKIELDITDSNNMTTYIVNNTSNNLSSAYDVSVIKSRLYSKTSQGYGKVKATSKFAHKELELVSSIPRTTNLGYLKSNFNSKFPVHRNEVLHIEDFLKANPNLMLSILHNIDLSRMGQVRVANVLVKIEQGDGNTSLVSSILADIQQIDFLDELFETLGNYIDQNELMKKLVSLYQLVSLIRTSRTVFMNFLKRELYKGWKARLNSIVQVINTAGASQISLTENAGKLKFNLSNVTKMSNGQRDVVSFVSQLYRTEYEFLYKSSNENSIVIIDEIFDYLDNANIITCQYFISKFLEDFKLRNKNIFPLILTHLAPAEFDTYRLKKVKCHFLQPRQSRVQNQDLRNMIKARADRTITDTESEELSAYYLHYHSTSFSNPPAIGLSNSSLDNQTFYQALDLELQNFIGGGNNYDPFSICAAIRIRAEKKIYNSLNPGDQAQFLRERGTNNKLEYASSKGVSIPEIFYLMGVLYNEALHVKGHQFSYYESKIDHQIKNTTICNLIKEIESMT